MKYLIISIFAARKCGLKVISKLGIKDKTKTTCFDRSFFVLEKSRIARFENLNATVRGTVACRQLDGCNTIIFIPIGTENAIKSSRYQY